MDELLYHILMLYIINFINALLLELNLNLNLIMLIKLEA